MHDAYRPDEEKGSTPGPLAGLFPLWYPFEPDKERATLDYYLKLAPDYIGSPMLSPFYGVWAAWAGDRALSARLLDEGYAQLIGPRYLQTLEMSPAKFPETPPSGPFFANLGGFLMGLALGFPGIRIGDGPPESWPARPVVLPAGWRSIEVERAWIRTRPARIVARHGDERARIEVDTGTNAASREAA
jgi:protein-glucosylgalactosylhydroxylysine glucosidase